MERSEETIFAEALEKPAEQRAAYLDAACAGDSELRKTVESLLVAYEEGEFLESPARGLDVTIDQPIIAKPGARIGPYKLLQQLGEGGMGVVYMAEQKEPVKRRVALKIIKPGMDTRQVIARFQAERQALAMMDHPNIAKVLDVGQTDAGRPYFVMELVNGISVTQYCDEQHLTPKQRLELFIPICQAVQHAHQKGIIHRDLKPSNVLVALYDGQAVPKVIDFGVAKSTNLTLTEKTMFTQLGQIVGTLEYMSPEQAQRNQLDVDTRSDIYSLGVLLYELLTGDTPFDRVRLGSVAFDEMLRIIREEEPSRPSIKVSSSESLPTIATNRRIDAQKLGSTIRGELDWIVMKALEKDRARRYDTANGFAMDVQRFLAGEPVLAVPPSVGYRMRKFARQHRAGLTTAAAIGLLLVAGGAVSTWQAVRATQAERAARIAEREARRAQQAEVERAEGERRARLHAEAQEAKAEMAAARERDANRHAQKRLAQIEKANDILGSIFRNLDPNEIAEAERPLQEILVENLDQAAAQLEGEAIGDPLTVATMQATLGESLLGLGKPDKAIGLLEKARATRQARLGATHHDTLVSKAVLAHAYSDAGKLDLALPLYEETLNIRKETRGATDLGTLTSMNSLAGAYLKAGKLDLALPMYEETLKLRKAAYGADRRTLAVMGNLARAYRVAGKLDRALSLYEETLKLQKAEFSAQHPATLTTQNNLAMAYQEARRLDLALPLFEKTFELARATLGDRHPTTLVYMNNLGRVYHAAGKLDLALPLRAETFKLMKAVRGEDHPNTLASMGGLAETSFAAGKQDQGIALAKELIELLQAKLGADHLRTANAMQGLGYMYWRMRQFENSIPLYEKALKIQEAKLGRNNRITLFTALNLGYNYRDAGRLKEAIPLFAEAYRAAHQFPELRAAYWPLIDAYISAGDTVKLTDQLYETLAEAYKEMPPFAGQQVGFLTTLGRGLLKQQEWAKAEPVLRDCRAACKRKNVIGWRKFNVESMLGGALLGQKRYAEAEPLLLSGYEGMKEDRAQGPDPLRMEQALERLVKLYEAIDEQEEAAKWRAELDKRQAEKDSTKAASPESESESPPKDGGE